REKHMARTVCKVAHRRSRLRLSEWNHARFALHSCIQRHLSLSPLSTPAGIAKARTQPPVRQISVHSRVPQHRYGEARDLKGQCEGADTATQALCVPLRHSGNEIRIPGQRDGCREAVDDDADVALGSCRPRRLVDLRTMEAPAKDLDVPGGAVPLEGDARIENGMSVPCDSDPTVLE